MDVTSMQIINPQKGDKNEISNPYYREKKRYTKAEVEISVAGLNDFVFKIEEFVLPAPNSKDENNYYDWYSFKSIIETYLNCEKVRYNIQKKAVY